MEDHNLNNNTAEEMITVGISKTILIVRNLSIRC